MYYSVTFDHPDYGHVYPCDCTARKQRERRRQQLREECGLGALSRLTFDSFSLRQDEVPYEQHVNLYRVWEAVQGYAETPWPRGWLLLYGSYGCGKTHLAAAAVNHRIDVLERAAIFIVIPEFLNHLRWTLKAATPGEFEPYFQRIKHADFLVLDDLGTEYWSEWVDETMFELVNFRYANELPTIVTSNVPLTDLQPRIQSRILDAQFVEKWVIEAPDYRLTSVSQLQSIPKLHGNAVGNTTQAVPARRRGKLPKAPRRTDEKPLVRHKDAPDPAIDAKARSLTD